MGPLVDRTGNRLGLRIAILASAGVPIFALWVASMPDELGRSLFPLIFVGVGVTPVVFRLHTNYLLEIVPRSAHPRALAVSQLGSTTVLLVSPALGGLVDGIGYGPVFVGVSLLIAAAGALTFVVHEPRQLTQF